MHWCLAAVLCLYLLVFSRTEQLEIRSMKFMCCGMHACSVAFPVRSPSSVSTTLVVEKLMSMLVSGSSGLFAAYDHFEQFLGGQV